METRSKRRKRQRLMSISSNISSWPDVPARFESLNDDTLTTVLEFVGNKSYGSFGGLNYHCKDIYLSSGMVKETFLYGYAPLAVIIDRYDISDWDLLEAVGKGVLFYNRRDVLDWALQHQEKYLLQKICYVSAGEGRINLPEEMWDNVKDWGGERYYIFASVIRSAASHGRLNVLKWLETKGFEMDKKYCGNKAAYHGHLHIIQWLKEEKRLKLDGYLYNSAAKGGHLHVMKWLREKEVDWDVYTFVRAAEGGNLDILQWLHDEGCPWKRSVRVGEDKLYSGAIDWCRANGYYDRIVFFFQ